jgi:glycogen operon protein
MNEETWNDADSKSVGILLDGRSIPNPNPRAAPVLDDYFYLMFNAHSEPLVFAIPPTLATPCWTRDIDTAVGWIEEAKTYVSGDTIRLEALSLVVLHQEANDGPFTRSHSSE